jgi:hypothetical protein
MTDEETEQAIKRIVCETAFVADVAWIASEEATTAGKVRVAIDTVVRWVLGNGLMQLVPPSDWPEYLSLNPPYNPRDVYFGN